MKLVIAVLFRCSTFCVGIALCVWPSLAAQSAEEEKAAANFSMKLVSPPAQLYFFHQRFNAAFTTRANNVFADQLCFIKIIKWDIELADRHFENFHEHFTTAGREALGKSILDSAREATAELPFFNWLEEHQSFVADFVRNSVANVEEESVSPLDVSYSNVERHWWQRLSDQGKWRYGVRPFKTDPYSYVSYGVKEGETLVLLANARYHCDHFADHRFEFALSVPLLHGFAFDVGASHQFGPHGEKERLVFKVFKEFKTGGIVHVGFEVKNRPTLIAGTTFTW